MFKITHAQLTRRAIGYRTFATQSNSSGGNSNGLALAAAGALGIAGYMYYNSSNGKYDVIYSRNDITLTLIK
jgi:hypothetical protein